VRFHDASQTGNDETAQTGHARRQPRRRRQVNKVHCHRNLRSASKAILAFSAASIFRLVLFVILRSV